MAKSSPPELAMLRGMRVSGICFVQDYVELHFDGPILRALTWPILNSPEEISIYATDSTFRDRICQLIGLTVIHTHEVDDKELQLTFDTGWKIRIPLDIASRVGPEAVHLVEGLNGPISVW